MVEVTINGIKWVFRRMTAGSIEIMRNDKIIGYAWKDMGHLYGDLLQIVLDAICADIKAEIRKEQQTE